MNAFINLCSFHSYKQTEIKGFSWMSNLSGLSKNLVGFAGNILISSLMHEKWGLWGYAGKWLPEPQVPRERSILTSASDLQRSPQPEEDILFLPTCFLCNTSKCSALLPRLLHQNLSLEGHQWHLDCYFKWPLLPNSLLFISVISGTVDTVNPVSPWIPMTLPDHAFPHDGE